jgi:hypothetical protein
MDPKYLDQPGVHADDYESIRGFVEEGKTHWDSSDEYCSEDDGLSSAGEDFPTWVVLHVRRSTVQVNTNGVRSPPLQCKSLCTAVFETPDEQVTMVAEVDKSWVFRKGDHLILTCGSRRLAFWRYNRGMMDYKARNVGLFGPIVLRLEGGECVVQMHASYCIPM